MKTENTKNTEIVEGVENADHAVVADMPQEHSPVKPGHPPVKQNVYLAVTAFIQLLLVVALVWYFVRGDWENAVLTAIVIILTLAPMIMRRQYHIRIPPEFQLISTVFVFMSLFLGSAMDLYYQYWWWDIVLHGSSGFILGIIGFLFLFLLNQSDRIPKETKPALVCFFAVTVAVFLGVVWEMFEFAVDQIWPEINMQSTETGVVDTMKDLIVNMTGASVVAVMGWVYLRTGRYSFIADGVRRFVARNPELFGRMKSRISRMKSRRKRKSKAAK